MKIILLQDIKNLGKIGDIKNVAEGYARNFLLPKKMVEAATEEVIKKAEVEKAEEKSKKEAELEDLKNLAKKIKDKKITIKSKEKKGKLFGSIGAKDITEAMKKENLEISQSCIIMKEAIKKTGEYKIDIILSPGISVVLKLEIEGEE